MSNISSIVKSIQDIMRKYAGVDGDAQRIGQMVWMFFLKIYDDREAELELVEDNYQSPLPEHLRWRSWAPNKEGLTGDGLAGFVNLQLFPNLKTILPPQGEMGRKAQVVRDVFEDANNFMKNGTLIRNLSGIASQAPLLMIGFALGDTVGILAGVVGNAATHSSPFFGFNPSSRHFLMTSSIRSARSRISAASSTERPSLIAALRSSTSISVHSPGAIANLPAVP
jgi:hypothetical protein